jgi:hypothetical protein
MARVTDTGRSKGKGRPGSWRGADGRFIPERGSDPMKVWLEPDDVWLNEPHVGATAMQVIAALITGAFLGWIAGAFVS